MALRRVKLGVFLEYCQNKNVSLKYGENDARGVDNKKKIIKTKADVSDRDFSKFLIVNPGEFFFNHRTSRHGDKFCVTYNYENNPFIVTEDYDVFRIKKTSELMIEYLYIYFNRPEFDRYVMTNSWGSSTEFFSYDDLCDIEIELPDIKTQKKFVDAYLSMIANRKAYEKGLEDLKLICDGYIENLRRKMPCERIGKYIVCTDRKTDDPYLKIQGISNQRKFNDSNSRVDGVDTEKYLRIDPREFGYSPIHINDGSIAFNKTQESFLLSPIYKTFKVINENELYPEYLMMWFSREEFARYCTFHAFGSARDNFEWEQMCEVEIPIPSIEIQKSIADIFRCYIDRKEINEKLKNQIKDICPILIKGSIEEARTN